MIANSLKEFQLRVLDLFKAVGSEIADWPDPRLDDVTANYGTIKFGPTKIRVLICCVQVDDQSNHINLLKFFQWAHERLNNGTVDRIFLVSLFALNIDEEKYRIPDNLEIATYTEILESLVGFGDYVRSVAYDFEHFSEISTGQRVPLIEQYRWFDLQAYFVDLECVDIIESANYSSVLQYIDNWLQNTRSSHLSLLGDYGTGKSSVVLFIAYLLARRYLNSDGLSRIPIFIPLKRIDSQTIQTSIIDVISQDYGLKGIDFKIFFELVKSGHFLLIFDGFDEIVETLDRQKVIRVFNELSRFAIEKSKVILTCRTHYFHNERQSIELLSRESMTPLMREIQGQQKYSIVELRKFDEERILKLLAKHSSTYSRSWTQIQTVYNLADLARTPILLNMIIQSFDVLQLSNEATTNASRLYDIYTRYWLERDDDRSSVSRFERELFVEELAWQMYFSDLLVIQDQELSSTIRNYFSQNYEGRLDDGLFRLNKNIRTCSFLARDRHGNYSFAHKSFMEFFVAKKLAKITQQWERTNVWSRNISYEVISFLQNLLTADDIIQIKRIFLNENNDDRLRALCIDLLINLGNTIKDVPIVFRVQFSPIDRHIVSVHGDTSVRVWQTNPVAEIHRLNEHTDWIRCMAFSQNNKILATGGWDEKVVFWTLPQFSKQAELAVSDRLNAMCFSADSAYLFTAGYNNVITKWDVTQLRPTHVLYEHTDNIRGIATDSQNRFLVSAGLDKKILLWDINQLEKPIKRRILEEPVTSIGISPNGEYLVSGTWEGVLTLWQLTNLERVWETKGHANFVNGFSFSPDGTYFASCSDDRTVKVWNTTTGNLVKVLSASQDFVMGVSFSHEGNMLCFGGYDCRINLVDSNEFKLMASIDVRL